MRRIITAIGDEELNRVLKKQNDVIVENPDIQYQEGILEALEKYTDIELLILKDGIIGDLQIEELIRKIVMHKSNIKIILLGEWKDEIVRYENVIKVINNNINYVNITIEYLTSIGYINKENVTKIEEMKIFESKILKEPETKYEVSEISNYKVKKFKQIKIVKDKKKDKQSEVLVVIGKSGVRKDNIYFYIIKDN